MSTSHAHPRRKLLKNRCHFVLSSCFQKTIPMSPSAKPPPIMRSIVTGTPISTAQIHAHEAIIQPSQIFAQRAIQRRKPRNIEESYIFSTAPNCVIKLRISPRTDS